MHSTPLDSSSAVRVSEAFFLSPSVSIVDKPVEIPTVFKTLYHTKCEIWKMSEADDKTHYRRQQARGEDTIQRAKVDPKVSCPVVFGEYMRASGFFFSADEDIYLITARHNALPTNSERLETGDVNPGHYELDNVLPEVDIYLKSEEGVTVERFDIRDVDGVKQTPEIDVLGIPIDFDPEAYGYQIWEETDITSPVEADETLDVIGFDGAAFPDPDCYDTTIYRNNIRHPGVLRIVNDMREVENLSRYGLIGVGADENPKPDPTYRGLSGSPVLGTGLIGIENLNFSVPEEAIEQLGEGEFKMMVYTRAKVLPALLT